MNTDLYVVTHSHFNFDCIELKYIGVFSSLDNANKAIDICWKLKGFDKYPRECFNIEKYLLDILKNEDGFNEEDLITVEY